MRCYQCGAELSEKDFCTNCGADVVLYKKIMHMSNRFYNEGLAKATVRDLSGAVVNLRQALKFNKNHIDARNLLGLVYFEMGETVAALSEWVISKNIRPQKNIADDFINDIQSNPAQQEMLDQATRKYNQALAYCNQDSNDLAIIQLKKVVSTYPRFLKAQQLLALLYIEAEEWEKARRVLNRCLRVDVNNTTTLRYIKEVDMMLDGDESAAAKKKKAANPNAYTYQSGNETIIQPRPTKEPLIGPNTVLNIIIGIAIGIAVCMFLIVPARVQSAKNSLNDELKQISENSDKKTAQISDLEQRVSALTDENEKMSEQLNSYYGEGGALQTVDSLLTTVALYIQDRENLSAVSDGLYGIDKNFVENEASEAYRELYNAIMTRVGPDIATQCFETGLSLKNQGDYTSAIDKLEKAWYFNNTNPEILYNLAAAYQASGNMDKANELYNELVGSFPESEFASMAERNIANANTVPQSNSGEVPDGDGGTIATEDNVIDE